MERRLPKWLEGSVQPAHHLPIQPELNLDRLVRGPECLPLCLPMCPGASLHVLGRMSEEAVAMRGEAQSAGLVLDAGVTEEPR